MSTPDFATNHQLWFGPAKFLRGPYQPDFKDTDIGLVGVSHCGGNLVGANIVCYSPPPDNSSQITAITESLLMLEFVTLTAERLAAKG